MTRLTLRPRDNEDDDNEEDEEEDVEKGKMIRTMIMMTTARTKTER